MPWHGIFCANKLWAAKTLEARRNNAQFFLILTCGSDADHELQVVTANPTPEALLPAANVAGRTGDRHPWRCICQSNEHNAIWHGPPHPWNAEKPGSPPSLLGSGVAIGLRLGECPGRTYTATPQHVGTDKSKS